MSYPTKLLVLTLMVAVLLLGIMVPFAAAQQQDGLVNVAIGDITIRNVTIAAQVAAAICANLDLNAAVLAVQGVDEENQVLQSWRSSTNDSDSLSCRHRDCLQ
jgi:hypothetical protein